MEKKRIQLDELNLCTIATTVLKNFWIVVLFCASVILGYNASAKLIFQPVYTASATLTVSVKNSTNAYNSLTTTQSMATVFAEVFQSDILQDKVSQQMPDGKLIGTIETTIIPETNLLVVSVSSSSPQRSFTELNGVLNNFESISDHLFANAQLDVITGPGIPTTPSNSQNLAKTYPLFLVVTALGAIAVIVALHIMQETVQTPASARRNIDARVLRTIRHEQKNKTLRSRLTHKNTAPLINNPLISKAFIEDNLSLCTSVEYYMRKRGQKVIMVTSTGENEGKSTVAANLALALAEKNERVILLDCDFRKPSLHKIFENSVSKGKTFSAYLLQEDEDVDPHLVYMPKNHITVGFSRPEHKSITEILHSGKLRKVLQQLRQEADYIVLDTPPMLAAADTEIIGSMADTSVVVVGADLFPIPVINDWIDNLRKSTPSICGVVLNNYRKNLF